MRAGPLLKNLESLSNLEALLNDVVASPQAYLHDVNLRLALSGQHTLAKYENISKKILSSSLNTQKRLAADGFDGAGYAGLNALRFKAEEKLKAAVLPDAIPTAKKQTLVGLKADLRRLKVSLTLAHEDCSHLSSAFSRAISAGSNLAAECGDPALTRKWDKTRRDLFAMVTLSSKGLYSTPPAAPDDEPS